MFPASLVRGCGRLRAPLGRWLLAGPCVRWRPQPRGGERAVSPTGLRPGAAICTRAGGLSAGKPGGDGKHVSVRTDQKEETLLSTVERGKACEHWRSAAPVCLKSLTRRTSVLRLKF